VTYQWDEPKNAANFKKHKVRFESAVQVFDDPDHIIERSYDDPETGEPRYKAIGVVPAFPKELVVIHVYRENEWQAGQTEDPEEIIRVISARKANPGESRRYQGLSAI
jgi:hypothetical protein